MALLALLRSASSRLQRRPRALALLLVALAVACADGTGPDEPRTQRLTIYANSGLGIGSTPTEVWINGRRIGTLTQAFNPPPYSSCDQSGGVSVDIPRNGSVRMLVTRTSDGAVWGEYEVDRDPADDCVVRWVGAHMFPPLGGGGTAVNDCVIVESTNGGGLGFSEWRNLCGYKVHFAWFDQGSCSPVSAGNGTYIGCGGSLDAFATGNHTPLQGSYVWGVCRDPDLPVQWSTLGANGLPTQFYCR